MNENSNIVFVQLTQEKLRSLLESASTLAAMNAMRLCGVPVRDMYSRAELSKKFGRGKIDRLHKAGKLTPHQIDGGRVKYNLNEVLTLIN